MHPMGIQMASRWLVSPSHFKRVQRHVRNSHISTLEMGPPPPFLFPTMAMIIGRCGYAMRGADTWPVSEGGLEPITKTEFLVEGERSALSPMDVGGGEPLRWGNTV